MQNVLYFVYSCVLNVQKCIEFYEKILEYAMWRVHVT